MEKTVAVVNGEILSLEDFGDDLALTTIYQADCSNADCPQSFHRFVDQTLLWQEAVRTRIIEVDEVEVNDTLVS